MASAVPQLSEYTAPDMAFDSTEWSAVIAAVAVIVSSSASGYLTYRITTRSITQTEGLAEKQREYDNGQRELDRQADIDREYHVRLFDRRVEIATAYLSYLDDRTQGVVKLGNAVQAGKVDEIDTSGFSDLLSHRAVAGVFLLMPDSVVEKASDLLDAVTATAEAVEEANGMDDYDERTESLRSAVADMAKKYAEVRDEMASVLQTEPGA